MPEINKEKVKELINEIRNDNSLSNVENQVKKIIEDDKKKAVEAKEKEIEEKKAVVDKLQKIKDDLKAEEEKRAEIEKKKKEKSTGEGEEDDSEDGSGEGDSNTVDKLTKKMADMAKEIEALKKQKNYRTKPPKAKNVEELDDFIKQNQQVISKDFEVYI